MEEEKTTLSSMHEALSQELLNRIQSGEATPQDLNVARQFLKDNAITALPTNNNPLEQLLKGMPFDTEKEKNYV